MSPGVALATEVRSSAFGHLGSWTSQSPDTGVSCRAGEARRACRVRRVIPAMRNDVRGRLRTHASAAGGSNRHGKGHAGARGMRHFDLIRLPLSTSSWSRNTKARLT